MRKKMIAVISILVTLFLSLTISSRAYALEECKCNEPMKMNLFGNCQKGGEMMFCDASGTGNGILFVIRIALSILMAGVGVLGTIGIIWCGYLILSARDNEAQVVTAKRRLLDIIIGIAAFGLIWVISELILPGASSSILDGDNGNQGGGTTILGTPQPITGQSSGQSSSSSSGSSSSSSSSSLSSSAPSTSRVRSCGPGNPGTPGQMTNLNDGGVTKFYTTTTGRTYYIYRQDDPRWGSENIGDGTTWAQTGCAATSYITVAMSFSNGPEYKPPKGNMGLLDNATKNNINIKKSDGGCSGNDINKIKCVLQEKGGVVIVYSCDVINGIDKCWDSGRHWFPIVDYRERDGKPEVFLANTIAGSGTRFKQGWVTWSSLRAVKHLSFFYYIPKDNIDCSIK